MLLLFACAHAMQITLDGTYSSTDCTGANTGGSGGSQGVPVCEQTEPNHYVKADCTDAGWRFSYHATSDCSDVATETCADAMLAAISSPTAIPNYGDLNCYFSAASGQCATVFDFTNISIAGITMDLGGVSMMASCSEGGSDPCFSATASFACLLTDATVPPSTAFDHCFGEGGMLAERVPMAQLKAGDLILASPVRYFALCPTPHKLGILSLISSCAQTEATRVIVNQHAAVTKYSNMLTLEHETGSLTLTPDHVVYADGVFQPAGNVGVGALLEPASKVTKISKAAHGIINPLTTSGTILAAGPTGAPVVSSALSEWIADLVLESTVYPLPYSLASAASFLFPHSVQAFYDAQLEQFFTSTSTDLKSLKAAVPAPVALAILAAFDVACVGAFAMWAIFSVKGAIALLAVAAVATSRRSVKA